MKWPWLMLNFKVPLFTEEGDRCGGGGNLEPQREAKGELGERFPELCRGLSGSTQVLPGGEGRGPEPRVHRDEAVVGPSLGNCSPFAPPACPPDEPHLIHFQLFQSGQFHYPRHDGGSPDPGEEPLAVFPGLLELPFRPQSHAQHPRMRRRPHAGALPRPTASDGACAISGCCATPRGGALFWLRLPLLVVIVRKYTLKLREPRVGNQKQSPWSTQGANLSGNM